MNNLDLFLAVARKEGVQTTRFSFTDNGQILCTLTGTINDRKVEATEAAEPSQLELACKGALYQWCEGLKANPPEATPAPAEPHVSKEDGKIHCSECGVQITEHTARKNPVGVCRNHKCISAYWVKRATLRRSHKG